MGAFHRHPGAFHRHPDPWCFLPERRGLKQSKEEVEQVETGAVLLMLPSIIATEHPRWSFPLGDSLAVKPGSGFDTAGRAKQEVDEPEGSASGGPM